MSDAPLDRPEFERWRREADRALESARVNADSGLHNWACFLSEQAAQLGLKALLHGLGRGPWGHDLIGLGRMCAEAGIEVPEDPTQRLMRLARHYIPARYPDAHASGAANDRYGSADSVQAIEDVEATLRFVDDRWKELGG
ncbi:MAG TPA: HEPN domain-containing protein [Actinomycetota bacterium]|nr:HEPN domain-containing protein [Actinomycetota bacterium]